MITVLIVDDQLEFRRAVRQLLDAEPGVDVVGEAGDGEQAATLAASLKPEDVLMDIAMREADGIEVTRQIVERVPGSRVLGVSMHDDRRLVADLLAVGASGFVSKASAGVDLSDAIRSVVAGGRWRRIDGE